MLRGLSTLLPKATTLNSFKNSKHNNLRIIRPIVLNSFFYYSKMADIYAMQCHPINKFFILINRNK
jgi:hypothetical protein